MTILLPMLAGGFALIALGAVSFSLRIARARSDLYDTNRRKTGGFISALAGRILPTYPGATDHTVNHYVEPYETPDGEIVWRSAGRLSGEAVSGVLSRH